MLTDPFDSAASEEGKVLQVFHTGISSPLDYMSHVIGCFCSSVAILLVVGFPSQHVIHQPGPGSHI